MSLKKGDARKREIKRALKADSCAKSVMKCYCCGSTNTCTEVYRGRDAAGKRRVTLGVVGCDDCGAC